MVFALLIAAILWNLATWWKGLPASSSHTMIGSIIGVGVANQLMHGTSGVSGVDWEQVTKVFKALLISPLVGFGCAGAGFSAAEGAGCGIRVSMKRRRVLSRRRFIFARCWCSPARA